MLYKNKQGCAAFFLDGEMNLPVFAQENISKKWILTQSLPLSIACAVMKHPSSLLVLATSNGKIIRRLISSTLCMIWFPSR